MTAENSVFRQANFEKAIGSLQGVDVLGRLAALEHMDPVSVAILTRTIDPASIVKRDREVVSIDASVAAAQR